MRERDVFESDTSWYNEMAALTILLGGKSIDHARVG